DWDNPPKICKSCKEKRASKWYETTCKGCGGSMWANRDWDSPPKFCKNCKSSNAPKDVTCDHCGKGFIIPVGTQIKCKQSGWELPRKCPDCRELFSHKPFNTVQEKTIFGNIIYRTYNSLGQLISESRDEKTFFGNEQRQHTSQAGKTIGVTQEKKTIFGTPYRETTRTDGSVKSRSREKTSFLGKKYTESEGGSSHTTHKTTTETTWTGKKYRKTE
ncbi:hypothetical protein KJ830_07875, partial [bacterium]|nr:hypothetical protein [bacterium]